MKKIFVLMASAAVLFAACNKMEEVNTPVDTPVETETITVVLNPVTKTSLDGKATLWTAGDKVSVTVGGKNIGTLALVEGSTFSGEVEAGHDGTATLNYPVDENGKAVTVVPSTQTAVAGSFANGAALLEGTTTMAKLRAGEGASLSNTTALLQFTVAQAGDVTFEVGTAKYTVTGCKTGETYYACVAPTTDSALSYTAAGMKGAKSKPSVSFVAGKIYPLGELDVIEDAVIRINNLNGWGDLNITIKSGSTTLASDKAMTNEGGNIFAYRLDNQYIGAEVTYYITHSWYQTSTKTVTLKADSEATAVTLNTTYLQPGTWDWTSATFGAWMWGTGVSDKMVTGVKVKDDFFEFEIPATGYNNVIFLRCNNSNAEASWDRVWNQTEDLTLKHMCFCVNSWTQSNLTDSRWY